jgi:uncharacterized protein (TIGR02118 family)
VTLKLVVMYTQPSDPDAFDRQYLGTHMPLVHAIPGLQRTGTGRIATYLDAGEKTYYRITELYFADQQALEAIMRRSPRRARGCSSRPWTTDREASAAGQPRAALAQLQAYSGSSARRLAGASSSGRNVSIITAVSSVVVRPSARPRMTASTAPGCGP